VHFTDSTFAIP